MRSRDVWNRISSLLGFLAMLACSASVSVAAGQEEYRLESRPAPKESLLNLILGSPPPMATERGILLLDAFLDANGNGRRDEDETELAAQISCSVDGIDYLVPAFVPGLKYEATYQISCSSDRYAINLTSPDIFVGRRGEVLQVDLPCLPTETSPEPSSENEIPSKTN